jgi:hypothetical protein
MDKTQIQDHRPSNLSMKCNLSVTARYTPSSVNLLPNHLDAHSKRWLVSIFLQILPFSKWKTKWVDSDWESCWVNPKPFVSALSAVPIVFQPSKSAWRRSQAAQFTLRSALILLSTTKPPSQTGWVNPLIELSYHLTPSYPPPTVICTSGAARARN